MKMLAVQVLPLFFVCVAVSAISGSNALSGSTDTDLLVFTVATDANDGFLRFMRSADLYGYNVTVLGRNSRWQGGDVLNFPGGGQKVNLLKEALGKIKKQENTVIMFVDSYDVVLTAGPQEVIKAFNKFHAGVVFSAEAFCWPDFRLAGAYPAVKVNEKRYLNSGGYIGYLSHINELLVEEIKDDDDDQLYFTRQFLDERKRSKLKFKLDTRSAIFQNLNGALGDVSVKFKGLSSYLYNEKTGTTPIVIHGNGPIKTEFNSLTNYLVKSWVPKYGCLSCTEHMMNLHTLADDNMPTVFVAIFIEYPTVFIEDFFQHFTDLVYPKKKIDLFIHYADRYHARDLSQFISLYGSAYRSVQLHSPDSQLDDRHARNLALKQCEKKKCEYYFSIDADVQLENVRTLQILIEQNRSMIAPLVSRYGQVWSNFWGALASDGFYKRSDDYMELVQRKRVGLWNVPYISSIFLVQGKLVSKLQGAYVDGSLDSDMAFCKKARELLFFMYLDNRDYFGHLTDSSNFDTSHLHNDLYTIFDNRYTWEKKYIDPEYYSVLQYNTFLQVDQPCQDVYTFPMVTPSYCTHLIEEMEHYGDWAHGGHSDPRLAGGYENVPTVDIHMNQIGYEKHWLYFLREFVAPMNAKLYEGYATEIRAIMNFVVRYRPGEQDYLSPHNDASTFTVTIALNRPGIDFQGGGCRFVRYNCSVTDARVGWMLMFPGRLTHQHEGLKVTNGTRYIMVSFIDP